jgi:hypothetical protein
MKKELNMFLFHDSLVLKPIAEHRANDWNPESGSGNPGQAWEYRVTLEILH